MIVVFASECDQYAKKLVGRWADRGSLLMTPADLSSVGWKCTSNAPRHSQYVLGRTIYNSSDISGVLVRATTVLESDLSHITPADRSYVAAEINAFMIYWLTTLGSLVINRPTPRSLSGPGWYPEHWMHCAASVGLHVRQIDSSVSLNHMVLSAWPPYAGLPIELTIVGKHCFGYAHPDLMRKACALAQASKLDLVSFRFDGSTANACFLEANVFPILDNELVEQALLARLEAGRVEALEGSD